VPDLRRARGERRDPNVEQVVTIDDDDKPKPVFAPDEQSLLPGYRRYVAQRPIDRRAWTDGHGNKIDSPKYRGGASFGGKTIAPLVGDDGQPIRLGTLQIVRDARGMHVVIDWSKPFFEEAAPPREEEGDRKDRPAMGTTPLMGKQIFRHKDLRRARAAMLVLHRDAEAIAAGLPLDPAQCTDDRGKAIRSGDLALCQYARGGRRGHFAIVDHGPTPRRVFDIDAKNKKAALRVFLKESARRAAAGPKPAVRGAPIAFDVPLGFGGGSSYAKSWADRSVPEEDSEAWRTSVALYARTGKWCRTANMIWSDARPPGLEVEAAAAREAFLEELRAEEQPKDDPKARRAMRKLSKDDRTLLNQILERFDGALLEIKTGG